MTTDARNILLGLGVVGLLLVWLAWTHPAWSQVSLNSEYSANAECEYGAFGCGHQENHQQYKDWTSQQGASCCNGQDCRPVRAKQDMTGAWLIYIPELKGTSHDPWVLVPPNAMQPPDKFHDGRSHACTADPTNWARYIQFNPRLPVYCFSPGQVRG